MSPVPALEDLGDLSGKRVLCRVDFNVPLRGGEITDDLRIRAALPTLRYLKDAGAAVVACIGDGGRGGFGCVGGGAWFGLVYGSGVALAC